MKDLLNSLCSGSALRSRTPIAKNNDFPGQAPVCRTRRQPPVCRALIAPDCVWAALESSRMVQGTPSAPGEDFLIFHCGSVGEVVAPSPSLRLQYRFAYWAQYLPNFQPSGRTWSGEIPSPPVRAQIKEQPLLDLPRLRGEGAGRPIEFVPTRQCPGEAASVGCGCKARLADWARADVWVCCAGGLPVLVRTQLG